MALLTLSFLGLAVIYICSGSLVSESGNFPLDGCSTDDMDVMCLYFDSSGIYNQLVNELYWCRRFVRDLQSFPSNKSTPRVKFADVVDRFSNVNESLNVNISSWHFQESFTPLPYGENGLPVMIRRFKTAEIIEPKIKIVENLFSGMSGVRENVTRVAVIFIDGADLSYEESRSVSQIVQQQGTDIKIFVVALGIRFNKDILLLNNTLLLPLEIVKLPKRSLILAICHKCMNRWWSFEDSGSSDSLSCYVAIDTGAKIEQTSASFQCKNNYGGELVAIETKEELDFLRPKMNSYLTKRSLGFGVSGPFSALVYIGIVRDPLIATGRFKWRWTHPSLYRPLAVKNWKTGKPSGGHRNKCGTWQFTQNVAVRSNMSNQEETLTDGWSDVECEVKSSSLILCEVVYPRRIRSNSFLRVDPAPRSSFNQTLTKGDFYEFEGNIVSVSANTANQDFVAFFNQAEHYMFPTFDCGHDAGNPRYISYAFVCDQIDHCSNKRDESSCFVDTMVTRSTESSEETTKCLGITCCDGFCLPLQFVNDGEVDCAICEYSSGNRITDESLVLNKYLKRNETCAFMCNRETCVYFDELNDGAVDCDEPDGPLDETFGKLEKSDTCYNILGQAMWAPRCVYVLDRYGAILGCRDMSHVQNCSEFACPEGYFKCPNTYCIPQHYVLDGTIDCPKGEDEQLGNIEACIGNFACWDSKICLHPDLVCNRHRDCPHGDDEVDCGGFCAEGFRCVSGTVTVSNYNRSMPLQNLSFLNTRTKYLDLSGLDLSIIGTHVRTFLTNASFVKWSHCRISNLPQMLGYFSQSIQELDLSYNLIQALDGSEKEFFTLQNMRLLDLSHNEHLVNVKHFQFTLLETLDLSHTGLSRLDSTVLVGLPSLRVLNLSFTRIHYLHKNTFPSRRALQTLDLRGLTIKNVRKDIFNGLRISHDLFSDSFELCCPQIRGVNIPFYTCHTPSDAISSCSDLVGLNVQRGLLWVVAALAVLVNLTVIVYRVIWDRSVLRTGYGLFVTNLGISDFIMGVYLFIIAGADYYYRGDYVLYDKSWRESSVCKLAGFLATISIETSTLFVFLITLDRFLVMKFPFGQIRFSKMSKSISLLLSWTIGSLLALTPVVFRFEIYSSNAMCLGLPLTTKRLNGWEFSFSVFIVLNFCMFLVIAYGQRAVYSAMSENRIKGASSSTSPRRAEDILAVKQLSLVALSNFLCWCPVGVMGLLALSGREISNDVYAWTTVIVLPINSAANPLLYTMSFLMAKWEKFRYGSRRPRQSSIYT